MIRRSSKFMPLISALAAATLLLTACTAPTTEAPKPTEIPQSTVAPTASPKPTEAPTPTIAPLAVFLTMATPEYKPPVTPPTHPPEYRIQGSALPETVQSVAKNDKYRAYLVLARQMGTGVTGATDDEVFKWLDQFASDNNLTVSQLWNGEVGDKYQMVTAIVTKDGRGVYWFVTSAGAVSARPDIAPSNSRLQLIPIPAGYTAAFTWGSDGNIYMYGIKAGTSGQPLTDLWFNATTAVFGDGAIKSGGWEKWEQEVVEWPNGNDSSAMAMTLDGFRVVSEKNFNAIMIEIKRNPKLNLTKAKSPIVVDSVKTTNIGKGVDIIWNRIVSNNPNGTFRGSFALETEKGLIPFYVIEVMGPGNRRMFLKTAWTQGRSEQGKFETGNINNGSFGRRVDMFIQTHLNSLEHQNKIIYEMTDANSHYEEAMASLERGVVPPNIDNYILYAALVLSSNPPSLSPSSPS